MSVYQNIKDGKYNNSFDLLHTDLAIEHGLVEHPNEYKLWELAYERAEASGSLENIDSYYSEMSVLLK